MKKSYLILACVLFLFVPATISCRVQAAVMSEKKTISVDGTERSYIVFAPDPLEKARRMPLVIVLHGGGGTAERMERGTGFSLLAEKEGFVAVYPQGIRNQWNDGRVFPARRGAGSPEADLAFIAALIDEVSRSYSIDRDRIYVTGASNGGFFSHLLGARMSDKIAAIAPVIGGVGTELAKEFKPSHPVPVFVIQGTQDPLVPYAGGTVARNRGGFVSTEDALLLWRRHNGTRDKPSVTLLEDQDPSDGCRVESYSWEGGRNGSEVRLFKMIGGGHGWPGRRQWLPKLFVGKNCMDFDATAVIWEFFKNH